MDTLRHDHPTLVRQGARPRVISASELGIREPDWPEAIPTTLGDETPLLRRSRKLEPDGRTRHVTYRQVRTDVTLTVTVP